MGATISALAAIATLDWFTLPDQTVSPANAHGREGYPLMMKYAKSGKSKVRPSHPTLAGRLLYGPPRSVIT